MREFFILFAHLLVTITRLMKPGGAKAFVAENVHFTQTLMSMYAAAMFFAQR